MRAINVLPILFTFCLISVVLFLSAAPSVAQPNDGQINILAQDISAYFERCKDVHGSPPTPLSRSCANERGELLRRQHDLQVSDAEINAQLRGRGGFGRWP
jgi:hypothetical protein